jgi:hypothetical protein
MNDPASKAKYRWTILPLRRRHGPWRETRDEAVADALAEGLAHREDYPGAPVCFDELVEVEREG